MRTTSVAACLLAALVAGCSTQPAGREDAVRTVQVSASDAMTFQPADMTFAVGETVVFEVTNDGELEHEFFIGDQAAQDEHAADMAEMPGMHDEPAGVSVAPGQTATLEYTFHEAGRLFAACHEPGHYEAGMIAELTVG